MNTLYWHVVDSHSFPLEVSAFPELAQKGAYSIDRIYSEDDVKDIIDYAAAVCPLSLSVSFWEFITVIARHRRRSREPSALIST